MEQRGGINSSTGGQWKLQETQGPRYIYTFITMNCGLWVETDSLKIQCEL